MNKQLKNVREEFSIFDKVKINGKPLVYLDSAATTLKPKSVVQRIADFNEFEASNVHRGAHFLSQQATQNFEEARVALQKFVGAESSDEIIFTKGTTESINLVAQSFGHTFLQEGDEIVLTELEHHANLVPWQNLALQKKLHLKFIKVLSTGEIDLASIDHAFSSKTKLVAFSGCSNILGTFLPIETIIEKARSVGAKTLLDAAQLVSQKKIDVQKLNVDFLVFSAHKLFGPFGFGVLYGKKALLEAMPPYQFGGSMISEVGLESSSYNALPFKFEAGTPHIEGAIGTFAALQFFNQYDLNEVFLHERHLLTVATEELRKNNAVQIFGSYENKAAILSFTLKGAHHADVGQLMDQAGIAVRVGHHCTQPLLKKFGLTGTVRASFSIYNNESDVELFLAALQKAQRMLL